MDERSKWAVLSEPCGWHCLTFRQCFYRGVRTEEAVRKLSLIPVTELPLLRLAFVASERTGWASDLRYRVMYGLSDVRQAGVVTTLTLMHKG